MTGKSHIACNTASAVMIGSGLRVFEKKYNLIWNDKIVSFIQETVYPYLSGYDRMWPALWWVLAYMMFVLGSLLPDCDSKTSMLGRVMHLRFEHRTWTHTFWFAAIFGTVACFYPWAFYVFAGYMLHLFFDALSYGGLCWFYPISKYRKYSGGAKVKEKHWCKLYRTGQTSEVVVDTVVIASAMIIVVICAAFRVYI